MFFLSALHIRASAGSGIRIIIVSRNILGNNDQPSLTVRYGILTSYQSEQFRTVVRHCIRIKEIAVETFLVIKMRLT